MELAELLSLLFPEGQRIANGPAGSFSGTAQVAQIGPVSLAGIQEASPLGVDGAIFLAKKVLETLRKAPGQPILMLVDGASQNMTRRDELLGLNEYLSHLAKSLVLAGQLGHRTVSILYGGAAAGAFIASCLASQDLVVMPGAEPSVMDLPSIARVTKLPLNKLKELAGSTPIFAPGVEPLYATGAISESWPAQPQAAQHLSRLLGETRQEGDNRDRLGLERGGRKLAMEIAERVLQEAGRG